MQTDAVADTGLLVPAAGGAEIAVHYERLPLRPRYRIGEALPFLPTGERFAAMRITDRLAAEGTPVVLPFPGVGEVSVSIGADGTLEADAGDGKPVPGTWRWSRGELVVALEGAGGECPHPVAGAGRPIVKDTRAGDPRAGDGAMRTPRRMAARMAGVVVAVVLAAAPGVAGTDDAPLLLLPEAAGEGAIGAPGDNEDSAIGGAPTTVVPAGVVPAEAVPALPGRRQPETLVPGTLVPETMERRRRRTSPIPGAWIGRRLAGTREPPAAGAGGDAEGAGLAGRR